MAMGEKLNLVEVERIHKDKERLEELLLPLLWRETELEKNFVRCYQQWPCGNILR